jgi:hypothetical protein
MLEFLRGVTPGEWIVVFATVMGPILAVQAQKRLERLRERHNAKLWVFSTLLNTRGQRLSQDHVRALNMIDVAFYGSKLFGIRYQSKSDKTVVAAWRTYLDNLGTDTRTHTEAQWAVLFAKRTELFVNLLAEISKSVGFDFDRLHIEKSVYIPVAHSQQEQEQNQLREAFLEVFTGAKPLKMEVASWPTNADAAAAHVQMLKQMVEVTRNGRMQVVVSEGDGTAPAA